MNNINERLGDLDIENLPTRLVTLIENISQDQIKLMQKQENYAKKEEFVDVIELLEEKIYSLTQVTEPIAGPKSVILQFGSGKVAQFDWKTKTLDSATIPGLRNFTSRAFKYC